MLVVYKQEDELAQPRDRLHGSRRFRSPLDGQTPFRKMIRTPVHQEPASIMNERVSLETWKKSVRSRFERLKNQDSKLVRLTKHFKKDNMI